MTPASLIPLRYVSAAPFTSIVLKLNVTVGAAARTPILTWTPFGRVAPLGPTLNGSLQFLHPAIAHQ
jgi:hypothetical protein